MCVCDIIPYFIPWAAFLRAKDIIICAAMQERSCPSVIVIDAYTFDACIMRKECRQSAVLHRCPTSSGSFLISPLHQQVARTLREEGQDTQLQDCRECQECKQVVPPRFLRSIIVNNSYSHNCWIGECLCFMQDMSCRQVLCN